MNCTSPVILKSGAIYPCGKCPNCRARDRQTWVFRLRLEYQCCNFGLFVTLTYDDEHLPSDGVSKRDVQLFLKRLRKKLCKSFKESKLTSILRYFIVSEYGDHTGRPHYHALLFFQIARINVIYDIIQESWNNGNVQFGEVEEGSIVYCTKYCLKGSDVPKGQNKNFRLLSKMNGGIGVEYLRKQAQYHDPSQLENVHWRGIEAPMPRYYRTKLLDRYSENVRNDICAAYNKNLERVREESYERRYNQFLKSHKDYRTDIESDRIRFEMWLYDCHIRRNELVLKRTKKQTIW